MTNTRVDAYSEVQWWPSPTHFAVMMIVGRETYASPDKSAPRPGSVRIRTAQIDLAERLNVSSRTIRKVFEDFTAIGIFYPERAGRRWYVSAKADDPGLLESALRRWWEAAHPSDKAEAAADSGEWYGQAEPDPEQPAEIQWYEPDPPATDGTDPGAELAQSAVAVAERPRRREPVGDYPHEREDFDHVLKWLLLSPPYNRVWWDRVCQHFEWSGDDAWEAYQNWHLVFGTDDPKADNAGRWAAGLRQVVPA